MTADLLTRNAPVWESHPWFLDLYAKLLDAPGSDDSKLVLTYGGARHNDVTPRPQMEAWSFGPRLKQRTSGRYVELDLIVPEYIKDNEAWKALTWYPHYDAQRFGADALLFHPEPAAYVLIFPRSATPSAPVVGGTAPAPIK